MAFLLYRSMRYLLESGKNKMVRKRRRTVRPSTRPTRGRVGRNTPKYEAVRHPFHIKFSKPIPKVSRPSRKLGLRLRTARQEQTYVQPATSNPVQVIIKGRAQTLYSKGKKLVHPSF